MQVRAEDSKAGLALPSTRYGYDPSLLRLAFQKHVRWQRPEHAAAVVLQYLRQHAVDAHGTEQRKARRRLLERMLVVAAEDAAAVPALPIAAFHGLAAGSKGGSEALGFGMNDALNVAAAAAAIAVAPRTQLHTTTRQPTASAQQERALHDLLRWQADLASKRPSGVGCPAAAAEWLSKLADSVSCVDWSTAPGDYKSLLDKDEQLPPECMPYFAVGHHANTKASEARFLLLAEAIRSDRLVGLPPTVSNEALNNVLKPLAYRNVRDGDLIHALLWPQPTSKLSAPPGSWQARVLAEWPRLATPFWMPQVESKRKRGTAEPTMTRRQSQLPFSAVSSNLRE